jgi:hypothetical protein
MCFFTSPSYRHHHLSLLYHYHLHVSSFILSVTSQSIVPLFTRSRRCTLQVLSLLHCTVWKPRMSVEEDCNLRAVKTFLVVWHRTKKHCLVIMKPQRTTSTSQIPTVSKDYPVRRSCSVPGRPNRQGVQKSAR